MGYAGSDVIVVTATAATHVKAFDTTRATARSFFAFAGFPGGVRVSGDGNTSPGPRRAPGRT